ncbi:MAG: STAS-like domain-containing protein [Candidatus Scalindua sp.]
MNNKERGKRIRLQIVRDVKCHSNDIAKHIGKIFSITPQAVNSHIKRLEKEERISSTGIGKGKRYFLGDVRQNLGLFPLTEDIAEDKVWRDHFSFIFEGMPENIVDICHYGFTEMVNNVIDHSGGKELYVSLFRDRTNIIISVMDDGEGIFRKIERMCGLTDERQALLELSKGKLTTDPDNHTGEGIFFTSRVFDKFEIASKGIEYSHDHSKKFDYIDDSVIPRERIGTLVYMLIDRESRRKTQDVFDEFTAGPEEFQFNKTIIPVRLAQYKNEKLVSRSQAKRLLARIENFENVIFDFKEVKSIGQAFADEIFRVYQQRHPGIVLLPMYMEKDVEKMVNKAIAARERTVNGGGSH